jgi:tetratricopeptide (TPR) repeat protein
VRFAPGVGLFFALAHFLTADDDAVGKAVAALQSGDLAQAEQLLQVDLKAHPNDAIALQVMGAVLDQEKKYTEADSVYNRALKLSTPSTGLLNNYGNHLLAMGRKKEAQAAFVKVLSLNPKHANAVVQVATLLLDQHAPAEASRYLERLPPDVLNRPDLVLLRIRTAYALHKNEEADRLLASATAAANDHPVEIRALAEALSAAGKYDAAESLFTRAVDLQPQNFDLLYDLGLAASHASHNEHAREVLQRALDQQPENVGVLYDLAAVNLSLHQGETALELLARARKLAPDRADVLLLLARTTAQLGYFGDAVQAWEGYLKWNPSDEVAKREHAFAEMGVPVNANAAIADLRAYSQKHPNDPTGHYELAVAESPGDPEKALLEITRALTLKPDLAAAHFVRGLLLYHQGRLPLALADFESAAEQDHENPAILERLGQNYLALERPNDALRVLQQAERVAPERAGVLLQLARALTKLGRQAEAEKVFARYREVGATQQGVPHPAGLVDFLSLSPAEQLARYRAGVERTVENSPDNVQAQVRYLGLLLDGGKIDEAAAVTRKIEALQPDALVLAEALKLLLDAHEFKTAKEMLQNAGRRGVTSPTLELDLALATARIDGPAAALEILNRMPPEGKTGDYFLALAQCLEDLSQPAEADQALAAALTNTPTRPRLYQACALAFLEHDRFVPAQKLLERAVQANPQDPFLRVLRAFASAIAGKNAEAEFLLIENRWPDWSFVWIAHALFLAVEGQTQQAQAALETAQSLGASGAPVASCTEEIRRGRSPSSDPRSRLIAALPGLFG